MRKKSIFLLLIFLGSLIPISPAKAASKITRDANDALLFIYISDAILLPENELDLDDDSARMGSPANTPPSETNTNPLLARIIHAKKMERNDLDANCKLLDARLRAEDKDCEADRIAQACSEKRAELNAKIGFYHKMRGDRRKLFTRVWHNIKRSSSNFWQKIGPVGRRFLRVLGQEALEMVSSGGFSGSAFKELVKHTAKSIGREQIKKIVYQGVQRLLEGQLALAEAAGVDLCDPDPEEELSPTQTKETTESDFNLPDTGIWNLSCQHTWQAVIEDYDFVTWEVTIDFDTRGFVGYINGSDTNVDGHRTEVWTWIEETTGSVTEDGFLWGDTNDTSTYSWYFNEGINPGSEDRFEIKNWIGTISADLSKVCFTRVGAREWFTIDWLRERGREEMLNNPGGLCEALCLVK
jgi:hypothetical protein